ncbi:MAG: hypothetical protein K6253_01805, partial [Candidatus Liberibacter asiaticus]|nr:hypothetical protein [Candidatus Liberibacter asiaticus]
NGQFVATLLPFCVCVCAFFEQNRECFRSHCARKQSYLILIDCTRKFSQQTGQHSHRSARE